MLRLACTLLVLPFVAACVTPPPVQQPLPVAKPGASFALGRVKALEQTDHMTQHVDQKKNILYFQNFGGGGVGVGVLLGPIGVAANMAMIEANTKQDVEQLRDKIAVDPQQAFMAAAKRAGADLQAAPSADAPGAAPYLYVAKANPETLVLAAGLLLESHDAAVPWTRKYMVQLPGTFTLGALASLDQAAAARIASELENGYAGILRAMARDSADALGKERQIKFKSAFLTPRFEFELLGNLAGEEQDLVWVRFPTGLYAIRRSHISYTAVEKAQ